MTQPRTCTVRQHIRKLRDRLDTPKHRELAAEIATRNAKCRVRVIALRGLSKGA